MGVGAGLAISNPYSVRIQRVFYLTEKVHASFGYLNTKDETEITKIFNVEDIIKVGFQNLKLLKIIMC